MRRLILACAIAGLWTVSNAGAADACGYYAVFQCSKSSNVKGHGYKIRTDDVDGFRPGWWCRVTGPYSNQSKAKKEARLYGGYVKYGCAGGGE